MLEPFENIDVNKTLKTTSLTVFILAITVMLFFLRFVPGQKVEQ